LPSYCFGRDPLPLPPFFFFPHDWYQNNRPGLLFWYAVSSPWVRGGAGLPPHGFVGSLFATELSWLFFSLSVMRSLHLPDGLALFCVGGAFWHFPFNQASPFFLPLDRGFFSFHFLACDSCASELGRFFSAHIFLFLLRCSHFCALFPSLCCDRSSKAFGCCLVQHFQGVFCVQGEVDLHSGVQTPQKGPRPFELFFHFFPPPRRFPFFKIGGTSGRPHPCQPFLVFSGHGFRRPVSDSSRCSFLYFVPCFFSDGPAQPKALTCFFFPFNIWFSNLQPATFFCPGVP